MSRYTLEYGGWTSDYIFVINDGPFLLNIVEDNKYTHVQSGDFLRRIFDYEMSDIAYSLEEDADQDMYILFGSHIQHKSNVKKQTAPLILTDTIKDRMIRSYIDEFNIWCGPLDIRHPMIGIICDPLWQMLNIKWVPEI